MYKYSLENAYGNKEVIKLFKLYYPEKSQRMVRNIKNKTLKYFIVARYEGEPVGALGMFESVGGIFSFSHTVTHPDHRHKFIGTCVRYLGIKYVFQLGAKTLYNIKSDNEFSHERTKAMGFRLTHTQGRNKHINRRRKRKGLDPLPVRYHYEYKKNQVQWKEVNRICKLIESGKQLSLTPTL